MRCRDAMGGGARGRCDELSEASFAWAADQDQASQRPSQLRRSQVLGHYPVLPSTSARHTVTETATGDGISSRAKGARGSAARRRSIRPPPTGPMGKVEGGPSADLHEAASTWRCDVGGLCATGRWTSYHDGYLGRKAAFMSHGAASCFNDRVLRLSVVKPTTLLANRRRFAPLPVTTTTPPFLLRSMSCQ